MASDERFHSEGMNQLAAAVNAYAGPVGRHMHAAVSGFGALAAAAAAERHLLAIRAVCPPEHVDVALAEASQRGWSLEELYEALSRGWLPPAVD